jgi:hypothetical protein
MGQLSERGSMQGTRGGAPLLGTPKAVLSTARKWAPASIGAPLLGNMEGRLFLRAFSITGISRRFSRYMQNAL